MKVVVLNEEVKEVLKELNWKEKIIVKIFSKIFIKVYNPEFDSLNEQSLERVEI